MNGRFDFLGAHGVIAVHPASHRFLNSFLAILFLCALGVFAVKIFFFTSISKRARRLRGECRFSR
jgi:hypothetical protein